jgi:hypothetical protein
LRLVQHTFQHLQCNAQHADTRKKHHTMMPHILSTRVRPCGMHDSTDQTRMQPGGTEESATLMSPSYACQSPWLRLSTTQGGTGE